MREIKIRGKRLDNGEWVYGSLGMSATKAPYILWADGDIVIDEPIISQESIGQYTVLKDRNGKEIYEGDIIVVKGKYERVVLWDEMGWALMPCEHYHDKTFWVMNIQHPGMDWWKLFANNIEVVGNIHDNPDLIK